MFVVSRLPQKKLFCQEGAECWANVRQQLHFFSPSIVFVRGCLPRSGREERQLGFKSAQEQKNELASAKIKNLNSVYYFIILFLQHCTYLLSSLEKSTLALVPQGSKLHLLARREPLLLEFYELHVPRQRLTWDCVELSLVI